MNTTCRRCKKDFVIDQNDQIFYQKMKVPNPSECPDCRFMARCMWRNETTLYSRTCDMCKKNIISMYNPKSPYVVYCDDCYRSEKWDARSYAKEYNYQKSFFEQLDFLIKSIPKNHIYSTPSLGLSVNSEYNNCFGAAKDCFFLFNGGPADNTLYSRGVKDCIDVVDSYFGTKFESSYESINVHTSSRIFFGQNIIGSTDCFFVYNCSGCINCFGCVNLRNKSYCWFNEQLTKEEYENRLTAVLGSFSLLEAEKNKFEDFKKSFPHRGSNNMKTIDCVGDYLSECKNIKNSFEVTRSEDAKDLFSSKEVRDSIGTTGYGFRSERLLEVVSTGMSSSIIGSYSVDQCMDVAYSFSCYQNSKDLFGCDSLTNAQYCILNKQYSKDEYEKLKNHIVQELIEKGDYGLMLPPELSPFGYNETIGNDNMYMTKEEVLARGFKWQDDIQKTIGKETISPNDIADNIRDIPDLFTKEILKCVECQRNYQIREQELFFYKRMKLPIPRKCFFCRHHDRIEKRGPYKFWDRNCALCKKDIVTNYAPERPEIVYCEECYKREVM